MLTETWLHDGDAISIPGFHEVARQNMPGTRPSANGTTIFVHENHAANISFNSVGRYFGRNKVSASWLCLHDTNIIVVYKSPTTTVGDLKNFMTSILTPTHQRTIVCGDFNLAQNRNFANFLEVTFGLKLYNTVPTTTSNTTIDLLFATDSVRLANPIVYESMFSFHKPVFFKFTN
jgi:hypothetical protein